MAKKKKGAAANGDSSAASDASSQTAAPQPPPKANTPGSKTAAPIASVEGMPLIICRNKHWRYISSFHGPWLHLPLEALESLAHSNYNSPRPRPIDPGVFFDLVKIRRLVGEATPLTVNAANGFGPGKMKLSHERKLRMRDQATKRLSQAYRVDEIATSVAIMQGTTSLENVAELVLDKKPDDVDATYVHFFHEKIPSRHVVESTPFEPLNNIANARPMEPEYLRTRAILRVFGEDFDGAVADLTAAIQLLRFHRPPTHNGNNYELVPAPTPGRRPSEVKLSEEEQPASLEMQLMFQRAAAYLSRACQCVYAALPPSDKPEPTQISEWRADARGPNAAPPPPASDDTTTEAEQTAARKLLKTTAKRALRDYMGFLGHIEYSPDFPLEDFDEYSKRQQQGGRRARETNGSGAEAGVTHRIYKLSTLFEATPPADLPPYPPVDDSPSTSQPALSPAPSSSASSTTSTALTTTTSKPEPPSTPSAIPIEYITYHPLLSDALHALLLCHSLIQTSAKELQRHGHMVARLTRIADGYPIFQASRSPARADWIEVLRRVPASWIDLSGSWESLCRPAPLPGDARRGDGGGGAWEDDGREYPIWTERAAAVVRWVKEAPGLPPMVGGSGGKKKRKGGAGKGRVIAGDVGGGDGGGEGKEHS